MRPWFGQYKTHLVNAPVRVWHHVRFGDKAVLTMAWKGGCCGSCTVGIRSFFSLITAEGTLARSIKVTLIVGTLLTLVNQGGALYEGIPPVWWKVVLTYVVPYIVSTHGSVSARLAKSAQMHTATPPPIHIGTDIQTPKIEQSRGKVDPCFTDGGVTGAIV
ncbi:hypothetical protein BSKO_10235 [Bryopsis sp. KO-2023]|nr:hypothetical protein BSKO_10235 [Bryopsis sp. KO-2023]